MGELLGLMLLALTGVEKYDDAGTVRGPWLGPRATALVAEIRDRDNDPSAADDLLERRPDPDALREILFYGDGPAVRVVARCLVRLRDRDTVSRILALAEADELGPGGYPAALFGWIVGATYDAALMPRIRRLLSSQDTRTRIFALEAARTLTYLRFRMPEREPRFANPGEVWAMRRWCHRHSGPTTNTWLRQRLKPVLRRVESPEEREQARRFFARFKKG
jgi:hypothetical protein